MTQDHYGDSDSGGPFGENKRRPPTVVSRDSAGERMGVRPMGSAMATLMVSGSDTGIGKTRVAAALLRLLAPCLHPACVIKPVETGVEPGGEGDAARAVRLAGMPRVTHRTFLSYPMPLAPLAAASAAGGHLDLETLERGFADLPPGPLRLIEGAGGVAVPLDEKGGDWGDLAVRLGVDLMVLVVADRLGAINQARLAAGHVQRLGLPAVIWLNEAEPAPEAVRRANREGITACGLDLIATQGHGQVLPREAESVRQELLRRLGAGPV